jgi:oligopeptide transport system permease protein
MGDYLAKKGIVLLCSLFVVITLTFFLMHAIPGDPFMNDQAIPEEVLRALNRHYGLDQPLIVQYVKYLNGVLHFDLGPSLKYQSRTVSEIIAEGFPISFLLGFHALCLAIIAGISLGAIAALYHLRWQDHFIVLITVLGISIPGFLLGTFLQYLFAIKLNLLPLARWGTFSHIILPSLTLAAFPFAFIARMTRTTMLEVLQQDYIFFARAKGLNVFYIFWKHVCRNALLPVITYLGPLTASVFTGSFVVEKIFGIPGLGQWMVASISSRDYTVIMGTTIFYSAILMLGVFIADLIACCLDPRIKLHEASYGKY